MANNIKGLTVEIGGDTTKLTEALADVNKKGNALSSELREINKLLKLDPGNTELIAQKQKVLADAVANTSEKLKTLKEAQKQAADQLARGEISDEQYRALEREVIKTEAELQKYGDELENTGKKTKDTAEKTKDAGNKFEALGKVCAAVGAAIGAAFAAVTAAASAAGVALADMTKDGAAYADTVLTESTVTGIATDKLQEYMYASELIDVSSDTLTKSMAKNIKSMKSAADGSASMAEAYKKLGVSVTDQNGNLRDSEEVYWELIDSLGGIENETERDAIAMQVLGKSAQELNPLIEAGSERMKELGQEAHEAGYVLGDETLGAFGAFDDNLQKLSKGSEAAKHALGAVLLPALTQISGTGVGLLNEFSAGVANANGDIGAIGELIQELIPKAVEAVTDMVPQVIELVNSLVTSLGSAIMTSLPSLLSAVTSIGQELLTLALSALPAFVQAALTMLQQIGQTLVDNADVLLSALGDLLLQLGEIIIDNLPVFVDLALQLISSMAIGLQSAVPDVLAVLINDLLPSMLTTLLDAIPTLIDTGVVLLVSLVGNLPSIISQICAQIPNIISSICSKIGTLVPQLVSAGVQLFVALVQNLPQIIVEIVKAIPQIVSSIVSGFSSAASTMANIGLNLVKGIWNGISDAASWLWSKVSGWCNQLLGKIKGFFGIHSPAKSRGSLKTTDWMGKMLVQGMANGIIEDADAPIEAMQTVKDGLLDTAGGIDGLQLSRSINVQNSLTTANSQTSLMGKLDKIISAIEAGKILTIDGKDFVGATAGLYDEALGMRRILTERGAMV